MGLFRHPLGEQINKISQATQGWQRADEHHQYISARLARVTEQDKQLSQEGKEADEIINKLQSKTALKKRDT